MPEVSSLVVLHEPEVFLAGVLDDQVRQESNTAAQRGVNVGGLTLNHHAVHLTALFVSALQ